MPGDILLYSDGWWFDWAIEVFGHSRYFHAAIYAGDDEIFEEQPKGVTRRTMRSNYGSHCIAVLPAPGGREAGEKALAWAVGQLGDPFDRLDFLVIFLQHVFTHLHLNYAPPGRYTCAEFVATAWKQANGMTLIADTALSDIEPADLGRLLPKGEEPRMWFSGTRCG